MLRSAPRDRVPQSFFERHQRRVAEQSPRLADVRLGVLHVTLTSLLIDRLQSAADDVVHGAEEGYVRDRVHAQSAMTLEAGKEYLVESRPNSARSISFARGRSCRRFTWS